MRCFLRGKVLRRGTFQSKAGKTIHWYCVLPEDDCQTVFINSMHDLKVDSNDSAEFKVNLVPHKDMTGEYTNTLDIWTINN